MKHLSSLRLALGLACFLIVLQLRSQALAQTLVFPSSTCSSATVATGGALSIITAGVRASFTISARDSTSGARSIGGDAFVLSLREILDRPLEPVMDAWNGTTLNCCRPLGRALLRNKQVNASEAFSPPQQASTPPASSSLHLVHTA